MNASRHDTYMPARHRLKQIQLFNLINPQIEIGTQSHFQ